MPDANEPPKSDAAKVVTFLPAVTIIAFLVLAIFNIGYFSKIGLHFLGVMDLTNLVYSPDHVDALVWALTELMVEPVAGWGCWSGPALKLKRSRRIRSEAASLPSRHH